MGKPGDAVRMAQMRARRAPFADARNGRLKNQIRWVNPTVQCPLCGKSDVSKRSKRAIRSLRRRESASWEVPSVPVP
jgi:hypothetical protein